MKFDLSDIVRVPGSFAEQEIDVTLRDVEGMTVTAPVRGKMYVSSTSSVLIIEGSVDTRVEMACCRCGGDCQVPVHAEFQEDFVIRPPQGHGQGPRVLEEEEMPDTRLFIEGTLDLNLDELLRQSILVALPIKPLCAEDCPGLCQLCGQRLNEGPCACPPRINPRMEVLRQLMEKKK